MYIYWIQMSRMSIYWMSSNVHVLNVIECKSVDCHRMQKCWLSLNLNVLNGVESPCFECRWMYMCWMSMNVHLLNVIECKCFMNIELFLNSFNKTNKTLSQTCKTQNCDAYKTANRRHPSTLPIQTNVDRRSFRF